MKKFTSLLCVLLTFSIALASCDNTPAGEDTGTSAGSSTTSATGGDNAEAYDGLFESGHILTINITMALSDRTDMLNNAEDETYYRADVTVDGEKCSAAGIRTRGNSTYVTESGSNRYSYKINFGKYEKGSKLNGLDQLCLDNVSYDPSYLREYLTYLAYAQLGVNVPLVTFAQVTINGEYAGFYAVVEAVDDSFLKRTFGDNDGSLYQANKGSTLLTTDTSTYDLENGDDSSMQNIAALAGALASGEGIADILDVSSALKYFAVLSVLGIEDSYLGSKAENFYFYQKTDGRLSVVPWGFNLSFGTDASARKTEYTIKSALITASVSEPYFGVSADTRPLCSVLLADSNNYSEYLGYVKTLTEFLQGLPDKLTGLKTFVNDAVAADTTAYFTYELFSAEFTDGDNTLLGFINARAASVSSQLAAIQ